MLTFDKVHHAGQVLKDFIRTTDVIAAPNLAEKCELYLKPENLQYTGSFKLRGAYYKVATLSKEARNKGIVACSAGNHAQGVALAAKHFETSATIFLPSSAPLSKIEATRRYGAEIRLSEGLYDNAYAEAVTYAKENGATFIHPFDDIDVIAGQATIGVEIINQHPNVEAVVVPVGGGGLISGVAFAVKSLNPKCAVYGVQANGADSMKQSYCNKTLINACSVSTFADGIAVRSPAESTLALCEKYVDDIVTVSDDETSVALLSMMERQKLVSEGAGAVAVAAVISDKLPIEGKKVCAVVSGGNIDVNILSRVISRGLTASGRLTNLVISLIDKPGQLNNVSSIIAGAGANVIGVQYTPGGENMDINGCFINISMETKNFEHLQVIKRTLIENGFELVEEKQSLQKECN